MVRLTAVKDPRVCRMCKGRCSPEERGLCRPCKEVRDERVLGNTALVTLVLRKLWPSSWTATAQRLGGYEEINQEGQLALIRAAEYFDPSRGFKFTTYATRSIYYALAELQARTVHWCPRNKAQREGWKLPCQFSNNTSLVHGDWEDSTPASPEERSSLDDRDQLARMWALVEAALPPAEWAVVKIRFQGEGGTLKDAGDLLGVTRERARQIQMRAVKRLRETLDVP